MFVKDIHEYAVGETIFHEGDFAAHMFVIEGGSVEISKVVDSKKKVIAVLKKGQIFGEMALVDDHPRMASATALENTFCVRVPKQQFQEQYEKSSPFIKGLLKVLIENLRKV